MVHSIYQSSEEKECGIRKEISLSDYIVPDLKTIEVGRFQKGKGKEKVRQKKREDRQIFTRHKAAEQPPHWSSLLRKSIAPRRAKYIVMALGKYESEKCTVTTRDLRKNSLDLLAIFYFEFSALVRNESWVFHEKLWPAKKRSQLILWISQLI